jgi:hypothetical protein
LNTGGELIGRLERRKEGQGDLVYHFEDSRNTQSGGGVDITYSMGEEMVRPFIERGYIDIKRMEGEEDRYRFSITDAGSDGLASSVR